MNDTPEPIHAPDSPTGVRQGKGGRKVRLVLWVSMGLAVVSLVVTWLVVGR